MPICKTCGQYYTVTFYITSCPSCDKEQEQTQLVENLQSNLKEQKDKIKLLEKQKFEEREQFERQVVDNDNSLQELTTFITRAQEGVDSLDIQINELTASIETLDEKSIPSSKNNLNDLTTKQSSYDQDIVSLDKEIQQYRNQITLRREEIEREQKQTQLDIENQITTGQDLKTKIEGELSIANIALEIAQKELNELHSAKQQTEQILIQENDFIAKYQTQINSDVSSKIEVGNAKEAVDKAREITKIKSENLDRRKLHQQAAHDKLEDLKRQLELARSNLSSAQEKIETPSVELNVLASDSHLLLKKITELKEKVTEAEKAVIGVNESGDKEKIDIASMKLELARALLTGAQEETTLMKQERDKAGQGVGELSEKLEENKSDLNKKSIEVEQAESLNSDSKLAVLEADKIYKSSQLELEKAENILKEQEVLLEQSVERISGIERQISDTQTKIQNIEVSIKEFEPNIDQAMQKIKQREHEIQQAQSDLDQALKGIKDAEANKAEQF